MAAGTGSRVERRTSSSARAALDAEIRNPLIHYAARPDDISFRLREPNREWDVERAQETNAAVFSLARLTLALLHDRRWPALPFAVSHFLLQHALKGWCPLVPVLRRLGFRALVEIERELSALKTVHGDYQGTSEGCLRATSSDNTEAALRTTK